MVPIMEHQLVSFITPLILVLLPCLVLAFIYISWNFTIFRRMGIKGPPPQFLFGNLFQLHNRIGSDHEVMYKWSREYGKVYGIFEGATPTLVISDPDMVLEILVKQYSNFPGRKTSPLQPDPEKGKKRINMFFARGPRWKRLRVISNQLFTTQKLKKIEPIVEDRLTVLMDKLQIACDGRQSFNIYDLYQAFTLDVIGQTTFGLQTNCQDNPDDPFLTNAKNIFRKDLRLSKLGIIVAVLPYWKSFWRFFGQTTSWFRVHPIRILENTCRKLIFQLREQRLQLSESEKSNFIQMMLEVELQEDSEPVDLAQLHSFSEEDHSLRVQKKLTEDEVVQQTVLFLAAGYETTSTTLGYATYLLANHAEIQEKLANEIDQCFAANKDDKDLLLSSLKKLQYLDWVIKEVLRLYPIAELVINRVCANDSEACGLLIPKGMEIQIDVWSIHHDSDIWGPDPDTFRPERHQDSPKHPMAWIPFGAGPRICIGMRLAILELKLTLAMILQQFSFRPNTSAKAPLKLRSQATVQPVDGIWVKLERRK